MGQTEDIRNGKGTSRITFDYLDTVTREVRRGQIAPADREHVAAWLAGRFTGQAADFAVEGCTGWRYVAGELAAAGITRTGMLAGPDSGGWRRRQARFAQIRRPDNSPASGAHVLDTADIRAQH